MRGSLNNFNPEYERSRSRAGEPFDDSNLINKGWTRTTFDYELPDGSLLYRQCRYDPKLLPGVDAPQKKFLPCRPANPATFDRRLGTNDCVVGPGERRVIYNWPAIVRAGPGSTVFKCEGEVNADRLIKAGLLATTVISHEWTDECAAALTGYNVIVLEDHDESGVKIAADAKAALEATAKSIRVVPLLHLWKHLAPERASKEPLETSDVGDWIDAGGDPAKLITICREIPAEGEITAKPHNFPPEETIAKWDFINGKLLLRKTVSITAAMSGSGKSTLSNVEAIAMASGKPLLKVPMSRPIRVLLINLEDNRNAMDKRIAAAMKHHGLKKEDIGDRLFVIAKGEMKFKIIRRSRKGDYVRNEPLIKGMISFLKEHKIDVLSVDPLIKTHGCQIASNSDPLSRPIATPSSRVGVGLSM